MNRLDFGGYSGSFGNLISDDNSWSKATESNNLKKSGRPESNILDDILDLNFDTKNEMMDLFAPNVTSTEDILDQLIRELDKEENEQQKDDNACRNQTFDFLNPFPALSTNNNFQIPSSSPNNHPFFASNIAVPLQSLPSSYLPISSSGVDLDEHSVTNFPSTTTIDQQQQQGFYYESSLPHLAETVEVELSHEHSYAVNHQDRKIAAGSSSSFSSSSSESVRNGFSNSPDRFSTLEECRNNVSSNSNSQWLGGTKTIKSDTSRHPVSSSSLKNRFDDEEDDNLSDFYSVGSPEDSYPNGAHNKSMLRRALKRRSGRSQFMYPFSKNDGRRDEKCPTLMLSEEERQLCEKEGIKLPVKFPLTKQEERELRRIRRKIRNKRSAQESRRKKHEYISSLEERVRACDRDNLALRRQVEVLSKNNKTLAEQLKKLQMAVNNGTSKPAIQAGTCLAVLLLSFALLVAPNYDLFGNGKNNKNSNSKFPSRKAIKEKYSTNNLSVKSTDRMLFPGNTRTLNPTCDEYETSALSSGDLSPSSSSSSSSGFFDDANWNNNSPLSNNEFTFRHHSSSSLPDDNQQFDDDGGGGGGSFGSESRLVAAINWTPAVVTDTKYPLHDFDDQLNIAEILKTKDSVLSSIAVDDIDDFSVEPMFKRSKMEAENENLLNPVMTQFAFDAKDGEYLPESLFLTNSQNYQHSQHISLEMDEINRTTKIFLARQQQHIKVEDY